MNRKYMILQVFLFSSLVLAKAVFATEVSLPELLRQDIRLRPYVKSLITGSRLEDKAQLLSDIESPETYRYLNFEELLRDIFNDNAWVPHSHEFKDNALQDLFRPYSPRLSSSDIRFIFLANVLYDAGNRLYKQTRDYTYLKHAASIGHDEALYKIFFIDYDAGKLEAAKSYLLCSGAQGNLSALLTLSEVFEGYEKLGLPKYLHLARLLCQEAADLGNDEALFNLRVATLTEGTYDSEKNFQQGIRNAKKLADNGNQRAKDFITGIMRSSGDALQEGNDSISYEDLDFLRSFLGWRDEFDD